MGGSSNSGFLKQLPSLKFQSASSALCHRFLNCHSKGKTSTLEATHVGPFTPHFSFPKYPSPLLPEHSLLFVYFSPLLLPHHPPPSPALRLIDSTTKCLWQMTRISERNRGLETAEPSILSGRLEPPNLFLCRLWKFMEVCPNLSRYLTYVLFSHGNRSTHN